MTDQELLKMAEEARANAYVPYSHFQVGAALLCDSGNIYTGCNIENASYSMTICAERTALAKAISAGERSFTALAVVCDTKGPGSPCGACRQFIVEFSPGCRVIMGNLRGDVLVRTVAELLPGFFSPRDLD